MNFVVAYSAVMYILTIGLESRRGSRPAEKTKPADEDNNCSCLNGGTCQTGRFYSGVLRCICPMGYSGDKCEIDTGALCYRDQGKEYRGTASRTWHGRQCLAWNSPLVSSFPFNGLRSDALQLGLGEHNYCRNPGGQSMPWCYYQSGLRVLPATCRIPICADPDDGKIDAGKDNAGNDDSTNADAGSASCGQRTYRLFKIVGGNSTPIESQPWVTSLFKISKKLKQSYFQCGASLISPCWVLTAAHCFPDGNDAADYSVILGRSNFEVADPDKEQKFEVEKIILHEKFKSSVEPLDNDSVQPMDNDIALVKLRASASGRCAVLTDYVQMVCLPTAAPTARAGTQCEVAGYGKESSEDYLYSRVLKSIKVQLISQRICQSSLYYGNLVNNNMFCAGDPEWKVDACKGDSGGPLTCANNGRMELRGIVSWGDDCAKKYKPGVYTQVSQYLPWIQTQMGTFRT